ncbi:hypothetical protein [Streptomyces sp. NBC_01497]|uniref:hypothetical protein n=1 Tax=Streptomyces sp. NBC_01497 TaxID=2903885 RepID=UPI002E37CE16|nr:hypothetical protein [Streptomyces sp. NBC_01497]
MRAFTTWKEVVGAGNAALASHALTTNFAEAAGTAAKIADCSLEHQPTFARLDDAWKGRSPQYDPSADVIPGARAGGDAWEVSGDLAALFRGTPLAVRFMRYLTSRATQQTWLAENGAGFSADTAVPDSAYPDATGRGLARTLHRPGAQYCWDASDALPPLVRDAFTEAVLRFLARPQDLKTQLGTVQAASDLVRQQIAGGRRTAAFLPKACEPG